MEPEAIPAQTVEESEVELVSSASPPSTEVILTQILTAMQGLVAEVGAIKKDQAELREKVEQAPTFAPGMEHFNKVQDPAVSGRPMFARQVTLATRPVVESPEEFQHCVSPGSLMRPS